MNDVGVVFASTGGNKMVRTLRSFRKMEPSLEIHIVFDISCQTWKASDGGERKEFENQPGVYTKYCTNHAHINGNLNNGMRWMQELGYSHAALFHDDLVFSPLPEHRGSISQWFRPEVIQYNSGIRFSHFETFVPDLDSRRHANEWDRENLENDELWEFLKGYTMIDGTDVRPPLRSFWFKYEGPDKIRKWNRLGPTGQIVPIDTWSQLGEFDEKDGIFYDGEYPSECFYRGLPPVYAVTNFPYIHLHNQTMNPWGDPAPGLFGDTMKAYSKRYNCDGWAGFWGGDWEQKWIEDPRISDLMKWRG